jgi:hypothetical protein
MAAATLNQWMTLPNSTVTEPNSNSFSGMILDDTNGNVWFAATGGHSNGPNNAVSKYNWMADSPSGWMKVHAATVNPTPLNDPYYSDGRPAARHVYESGFYDPDTNHLILVGCYSPGTGSSAYNPIDGFNITTGEWEPQGTYIGRDGVAGITGESYNGGVIRNPITGNVFWAAAGAGRMWKPGQATLTNKGTSIAFVRFPHAWDTVRNGFFGLMWGDGQDSGTGITTAFTTTPDTTPVKRTITLAASAGLTSLLNGAPDYAAMDHDATRDKYLFVQGNQNGGGGTPLFYEITPSNISDAWEVSVPTFAGSAGTVESSGAVGKLKYIKRGNVGGFLFYSNALYFLRTV